MVKKKLATAVAGTPRENALTAALSFASADLVDSCRDLVGLRSISKLVRATVDEALGRVKILTQDDIGVVARTPTPAEDDAAVAQAITEHEAWFAELRRARDKRAAVVTCLEHQITAKVDAARGQLKRAETLRATESDETKARALGAAIARVGAHLGDLEGGATSEHRCLKSEVNQLRQQNRAIAAASRRYDARLRKARDPKRFYDPDRTVATLEALVRRLPGLETIHLEAVLDGQRRRFLLDQADRVALALARAPGLRRVICADLATASPESGVGLTDASLLSPSGFANLTLLSLRGCHAVTDRGVAAVVARCPLLRELDVQYCVGIGDGLLHAVATAPCRTSLRHLNVNRAFAGMVDGVHSDYGPTCTDAGLIALARCCVRLERLDIRGYRPAYSDAPPPLTGDTFRALATAPALRHLDADGTHVAAKHRQAWLQLQIQLHARGGYATNRAFGQN